MIRDELFSACEFYHKRATTVHIKIDSELFYNGIIIQLDEKMMILQERMLGETIIFLKDIKSIEPYKERKNE